MYGPRVNSAVLFGSLRYNLGKKCKPHIMKQVANHDINEVAVSRIEKMWVKQKSKLDLDSQAKKRALATGDQVQFRTSTKEREKVEEAEKKGEHTYVPSLDQSLELKRETKKAEKLKKEEKAKKPTPKKTAKRNKK